MLQRVLGAAVLVFGLCSYAYAEFPREGVPEIMNGVSAPFVGEWSIGFPEGYGMINGDPVVGCDTPVLLEAKGERDITYMSPGGQKIEFELMEFSGRTTWLPEAGESVLAVWTGPDEFFSYAVELNTGRARWADPRVYRRCGEAITPE